MPSYRFCRPDDIPYLVRAVNECYDVHFPGSEPMTVERFRAEMKELDVWPSNSMVASSGEGPIAVLIGTKRPREVLIRRLGVRPGHRRQGHGRHLVTSLGQKLAVLGPDRLVAEVPRALPGAAGFFSAAGYRREATYVDWSRPPATVEPVPEELFIPTTVDELIDHGLLPTGRGAAWERQRETLVNRKDDLRGMAIASPERLEAFLLHRAAEGGSVLEVAAAGARQSQQREVFLTLLLRQLAGGSEGGLSVPKLTVEGRASDELPSPVLAALGFEAGDRHDRYAAVATPA